MGIFRCGKFRISNVCEISRSIFRPLCEINPARNLASWNHLKCEKDELPHKTERNFGHEMPVLVCLLLVPLLCIYTCTGDTQLGFFCSKVAHCHYHYHCHRCRNG